MKSISLGACMTALCSLLMLNPALAADAAAGKQKSAVCAACHGADGNSANPIWPKLAGQHGSYIAKQLAEFKNGKRNDPTMLGMSMPLSEEDMADLGAYYESQTPTTTSYDAELLQLGQDIYRGGIAETSIPACMSCHSPTGGGNGPANFPSLKGQHTAYTIAQLEKFKSADRANDSGKMMRNVSHLMSSQQMEAVAAYIAALK